MPTFVRPLLLPLVPRLLATYTIVDEVLEFFNEIFGQFFEFFYFLNGPLRDDAIVIPLRSDLVDCVDVPPDVVYAAFFLDYCLGAVGASSAGCV